MFEREYRDLSHVPRWGIIPVVKRQTVAEHCYYVTLYASHILLALNLDTPEIIHSTLFHCVEHDRSEVYTSDIPGPAKRQLVDPAVEKAYEKVEDARRFTTDKFDDVKVAVLIRKLADLMDEYAYWEEEQMLGNGRAGHMLQVVWKRLYNAAMAVGEHTGNVNNMMPKVLQPFIDNCRVAKVVPAEPK